MANYLDKFNEYKIDKEEVKEPSEILSENATTTIEAPVTSTVLTQSLPKVESNTEDKVELLYRGKDPIDKNRFIRNLEYNFGNWLQTLPSHIRKDNKKMGQLRDSYSKFINGIYKGEVVPGLGNVSDLYGDSANTIKNAEDKRNFFLKLLNKDVFDPDGIILGYISEIFSRLQVWKDPNKKNPVDYSGTNFGKLLYKKLFNGSESFNSDFIEKDLFDETTLKRGYTNRFQRLNLALDELALEATDDNSKQLIQRLRNTMSNGEITPDEYMEWSNIGINPRQMFWNEKGLYLEEVEEPEVEEKDDLNEYEREYKQLVEEMKLDALKEQVDNLKTLRTWKTMNNPVLSWTIRANSRNQYQQLYNQANSEIKANIQKLVSAAIELIARNMLNRKPPLQGVDSLNIGLKKGNISVKLWEDNWDSNSKLRAILDMAYSLRKDLGNFDIADDNSMIITVGKDGFAYTYSKSGVLSRVPVNKVKSGSDPQYADRIWSSLYGAVPSEKQGGVLKALYGIGLNGSVLDMEALHSDFRELTQQKAEARKKAYEEEVNKSGKTKEQYEASKRKPTEDWNAEDAIRIAAIGADLTSAIGGFIPGAGTAVSAGASVLSIAGNITADALDDSMSGWDIAKNAVTNLALSAAALIPGGGAGKLANTGAKLVKYIPKILSVASAAGIVFNDDVHKSLGMIKDGKWKDMTVEDWKNVAYATSAVAGLTNAGRTAYKLRKANNLLKKAESSPTNKVKVKTKAGLEHELKVSDVDEINLVGKSQGRDAANALFKLKTGDLNADLADLVDFKKLNWYSRSRNNLTGEAVFEGNNEAQARLQAKEIMNNAFKRKYPWLSKFANTDYDIYYKGKGVFPWIPKFNWKTKEDNLTQNILNRLTAQTTSTNTPTRNIPAPQLSWKITQGRASKPVTATTQPKGAPHKLTGKRLKDALSGAYLYKQQVGNSFDPNTTPHSAAGASLMHNMGWSEKYMLLSNIWRLGGKIERAKEILSAKEGAKIPFFLAGGNPWIRPFEVTDWVQDSLLDWDSSYDSSKWKGNTSWHGNASSLKTVYDANNYYTSDHDAVLEDILNYFDNLNDGSLDNLESFKSKYGSYNTNAEELRKFWRNGKVSYNTSKTDATAFNTLYNKLYSGRGAAANKDKKWYLAYDLNLIDTAGSTTWHRRVDRYAKEFDKLSDAEKLARIHTIKLKDGTTVQVYKKANGDIGILPVANQEILNTGEITKDLEGKNGTPAGRVTRTELTEDKEGLSPKELAMKSASDVLGALRYLSVKDSNKDIYKTLKPSYSNPLLLNYPQLFSPITGDYLGLLVMTLLEADRMRQIRNEGTRNAIHNMAAFNAAWDNIMANRDKTHASDDAEHRRTAEKNWLNNAKNTEVRVDTTNKNLASIHQTNKDAAQLKADYILKLNQAFQNLLTEYLQKANQKWTDYKSYIANAKAYEIQNKWKSKIGELAQQVQKEASEGGISVYHTPSYPLLKQAQNQMQFEISQANSNTSADLNGFPKYEFSPTFTYTDAQ